MFKSQTDRNWISWEVLLIPQPCLPHFCLPIRQPLSLVSYTILYYFFMQIKTKNKVHFYCQPFLIHKLAYHKHYLAHHFFHLSIHLPKPYIEDPLIFYTSIQNSITRTSYSLFNQYPTDTFIFPIFCYSKTMW